MAFLVHIFYLRNLNKKLTITLATNKHAIIRYQTLDKCFRNSVNNYLNDSEKI